MKKVMLSLAAAPLILGSMAVSASADGINILNDVKVKGQIRPRFETADVKDNGKDAANAFTNRLHISATAGLFGIENLTTTLGIQTVNNFGYTNYAPASSTPGKYDVVADPQQAMLSEAAVDYTIGKTALHAGRSHVNLDNQRFIGTVGWRQSERAYDTVYIANSSVENLSLLAAYVYGFAGVGNVTTVDTASVLLHAAYKVADPLTITLYDYMLASIHDTYGIALTGNAAFSGVKLNYRAEYAMQNDPSLEYQVKDVKADAYYMNLDLGANISGILAGVNYELLSGTNGTDNKTAFTTPLATGHKFNGWADKFLATPAGGLQDMNFRLGYKAKGFGKLLGVYHIFTAQEKMGGEDDLGTEIDALYANKIPGVNGLSGLIKYAAYSKGKVAGYTSDVSKFWLMVDYKFATK